MAKEKNQNRYNKKRAKILLKGLIPAFIGIFLPKKRDRIIFNSTRNEFYNYNSKYIFEYFIKNYPEYEVKFVINNEEKRRELNKNFGEENNYFIETESLKGMFYALRAKAWVTNTFETPVGGLFLKFNRIVYLLGHGALFRSYVFMENRLPLIKKIYYYLIKNNFSHYLVTSKSLEDIAIKTFQCSKNQIIIAGEPMSDAVFVPEISIIEDNYGKEVLKEKNILYAPTWRPDGSLKLFPFDDMNWIEFENFLQNNKINIFLRMHPSFQEDLSFYCSKSDRIKVIDNSIAEDINDVIGFFDIVITDYSSVHIGFMLTQKPVMFLPYDFEEYNKRMGFVKPYDQITPGPKPATMKDFCNEITKLLENKNYYKDERIEASKFFNDYRYNNCEINAKFVINEKSTVFSTGR